MSRTTRHQKSPGWEFWSRRPLNGYRGAAAKQATHQIERARAKIELRSDVRDAPVNECDAGTCAGCLEASLWRR
jgi:hypothetical protein